jgi:hypothetical protein
MNILSAVDRQSWQLLKASMNVMLRNRKLFWFAILGLLLSTLMTLFFLAPIVLHPTGYHLDQKEHWLALKKNFVPLVEHPSPLVSLYLLAVYFGTIFLTTFFNVAFYSEIITALNGRGVSVQRGLRLARNRLPSIFAWTLLAGAVGWIINRIEQRLQFVARIVAGFIGMAWSVAAVFAIPVIIQEPNMRSPVRIIRQSALALKKTWGESLNGYAGFALGGLATILWMMVPVGIAYTTGLPVMSIWFEIMAGIIWVLGLVFLGCLSGVVGHVYRCALYVYATEGVVPESYNQELMDMAWKVKKSSEKR